MKNYQANLGDDYGGRLMATWHVYRKGKLVVKWDLDNKKPMRGSASKKLLDLIGDLEHKGQL